MAVDILITNNNGLVQVRDSTPGFLAGTAMAELPVISNAYLIMDKGVILGYGPMNALPSDAKASQTFDSTGRFVFPSFVDSHTHLVFAASRAEEFVMKIKNLLICYMRKADL